MGQHNSAHVITISHTHSIIQMLCSLHLEQWVAHFQCYMLHALCNHSVESTAQPAGSQQGASSHSTARSAAASADVSTEMTEQVLQMCSALVSALCTASRGTSSSGCLRDRNLLPPLIYSPSPIELSALHAVRAAPAPQGQALDCCSCMFCRLACSE